MEEFNDLHSKAILGRLLITLKQLDDTIINSFKLNDLIASFGSNYYKIDLLHSIVSAIKSGIKPDNIVIFNKSINYKINNYNFSELKIKDQIYEIYNLGLPISLYPQREIFEFHLIFDLYNKISEKLRNLAKEYPNQQIYATNFNRLENFCERLKENNFIEIIESIIANTIKILPQNSLFIKGVQAEEIKLKTKYKEFYDSRNRLKNLARNNKFSQLSNEEKQLFTQFFNQLTKLDRPIIAIYTPEKHSLKFLCNYHFKPALSHQESNLLLVIEKITHNSPYVMVFSASLAFLSSMLVMYFSQNELKNKNDKLKTISDIRDSQRKRLKELYIKLGIAFNSELENEINEIKPKFLRDNLLNVFQLISHNFTQMLEVYKFDIIDLDKG